MNQRTGRSGRASGPSGKACRGRCRAGGASGGVGLVAGAAEVLGGIGLVAGGGGVRGRVGLVAEFGGSGRVDGFGVDGLDRIDLADGLGEVGVVDGACVFGGVGAVIISARAADSMARSERRTSLGGAPSGMKLSALVTRETRPRNPPSASAVMIPSDTPPVRRVSSAISTRPVARHSRKISSAGSGAIQRRFTTRQLILCARADRAARKLIRSP